MNKAFLYLSLFVTGSLFAQNQQQNFIWNKQVQRIEALKSESIPVSLFQMDSINIGNSKIDYFVKNSDFKDVYAPKKTNGFQISSERLVTVNNWKFYGNFNFSKYTEKQSGFTAMTNPYRDNPYIIADSITNAQWSKQHYLLDAKVVSPEIIKNVKTGIGMRYQIDNGARQVDPRPLDKSLDLQLSPFIAYDNKQWILALGATYTSYREDLNISLANNQKPKNIYKLLGIGEYLYSNPIMLSGSLSRIYKGEGLGINTSIGKKLANGGLLQVSFSQKNTDEDATDGTSNPYLAGSHKQKQQKLFLSFEKQNQKMQHFAALGFQKIKSENTEHIQSLNPVTQQYDLLYSSVMHHKDNIQINASYQANIFNEDVFSWSFGAEVKYKSIDEKYVSTSSYLQTKDITTSWFVTKYLNVKNNQLSFTWKGAYKAIGANKFQYLFNSASTNFVALNIVQPNFEFATTPYFQNEGQVQWTFSKFSDSEAQLYLKFNYQNVKAIGGNSTNLNGKSTNYFTITLGLYN